MTVWLDPAREQPLFLACSQPVVLDTNISWIWINAGFMARKKGDGLRLLTILTNCILWSLISLPPSPPPVCLSHCYFPCASCKSRKKEKTQPKWPVNAYIVRSRRLCVCVYSNARFHVPCSPLSLSPSMLDAWCWNMHASVYFYHTHLGYEQRRKLKAS